MCLTMSMNMSILNTLHNKQTLANQMILQTSYASQFLCSFDYMVLNSFFKLLCNLLSYDCSVFYSIVESPTFDFVKHLIRVYFTSTSLKIQTKLLQLFRLLSRNHSCAEKLYVILHQNANQHTFYETIKQNSISSISESYKFVRQVIALLRFWISWDSQRGFLKFSESQLCFNIFSLFIEHIFPFLEKYNYKSELQRIQLTFECFGLIRDVFLNFKPKISSLKTILKNMTYFNVSLINTRFIATTQVSFTDACLYKLLFTFFTDNIMIRSLCSLFVSSSEILCNINFQNECFTSYCDIIRHCIHIFTYALECENIIFPVIEESHLPSPPKKLALLLFSFSDDKKLDVFCALMSVCCNKILPSDIVFSSLKLFLSDSVQRHMEIQSHVVSSFTKDKVTFLHILLLFFIVTNFYFN